MKTVHSTAIPPTQLGTYLTQGAAPATGRSAPTAGLGALRQAMAAQPATTSSTRASEPAPLSGAVEEAQHAERHATRERLKHTLAHSKLMSLLVSAALRQPQPVEDYLARARPWLTESAGYLAMRLLRNAGRDPLAAPLSGYHQYEVHRLLATLIERNPDWVDQRPPETVATLLASPGSAEVGWPPEERPDGVFADDALDVHWGYVRALAHIATAALDHDFNRDLATVLADARGVLTHTATERTDQLRQRLALGASTDRIALLHYLQVGGRLYAATLARVHRESVALIQEYQVALNRGDALGADAIARHYQERRLGYEGIAFHFTAVLRAFDALTLDGEPEPVAESIVPMGSAATAKQVTGSVRHSVSQ